MRPYRALPLRTQARGRAVALAGGVAMFVTVALLATPTVGWTAPTWVTNLQPWQWYAIPNTQLSSVEPNPEPPGQTGAAAKITAWCGAALKRQGSVYLIGAAGGHADYAGNEVDALRLNTDTPRWEQLRSPSAASDMINAAQYYLDLRPSATHTYYASQFINARDRLLVMPSPGMLASFLPPPPSGWPYAGDNGYSFSFNLGTNAWDAPTYIARYTGGGDFTACLVAKHPVTEDVYYNRSGAGWWKWTQASNTWTKINNNNPRGNYCGAAIDPLRNRMLVVGSYGGGVAPAVLDLNGNPVAATFGGLGASSLTLMGYPGVVYDEASDRFLVVFNSGGSIRVRRVHPETWFVDEPTVTGTVPASRQNGIHNAAQYVPELGGMVIANSYGGNVYFMRTSASLPPPDSISPSRTSDLRPR